MRLVLTDQQAAFRDEVRTWLEETKPRGPRPDEGSAMREFDLAWQRRQFDGGWAGITWPRAYGGRGLSTVEQMIWFEQYALADAPPVGCCFVGLNHAGPTLIAEGTDSHCAEYLPSILRGETVWCQGFSEPGAGSDLASLTTSGVVDGDRLVVTGQKVWTSYADLADHQELLVRTTPGSERHTGLTWVICDMSLPGIEVRPLRTLTGQRHYAEVFYDGVELPLRNVVGDVGTGWRVAMSTLSFERGTAFMAVQVQLRRTVERLIEHARQVVGLDGRRTAFDDDEIRRRLAECRTEAVALHAMTYAAIARNERRGHPGSEGSMLRLYYSEALQRLHRLAMDIDADAALQLWPPESRQGWSGAYLRSLSATIGGGTSEIQRNIIGERVLGLPR